MNSQEIRKKFLDFFSERGHKIVPSSSLTPDDPSVLLTTAGMQQFKKYYTGEADALRDFGTKNAVSVQKCFRTSDVDAVGDESHLTFFEMLGNFSFGGYFKKEAIAYAFEFFKLLNLPVEHATVFGGDSEIPADAESEKIWRELGVARVERRGRSDNFWGPTGSEGPCGPTTELYVNGTEIWNLVFNEYYCRPDKTLEPLKQKGVDTGMGLERLAMVVQKKKSVFETDLFAPFLKLLPEEMPEREKRVVADHLRGSIFLFADGVRPSNKERGYVLRRILRRVLVYETKLNAGALDEIIKSATQNYGLFYRELEKELAVILEEFQKERGKFTRTLSKGIKELSLAKKRGFISAADAFRIYETFGLPYEAIKDAGGASAKSLSREEFDKEFAKHQEISRAGQKKKFGGHGLLLSTGEIKAADEEELKKATRLHTATHLLNAALRRALGSQIEQQGSDINAERARFDFTFPRKLAPEEIKKIEDLVNAAIKRDFVVEFKEMPYEEAVKSGAVRFWREKYPPLVKVYSVYDAKTGEVFSKELCGGPHVSRTGEIGRFEIFKEEASSAGIRRIRARLAGK